MMKYLLDTSILVDWLRGKKETANFLASIKGRKEIGISAISVAEIGEGAYHSGYPKKNIEKFNRLLRSLDILILPVDAKTAEIYGKQQAKLSKRGKRLEGFDMLIAATCLKDNLALLTKDNHFKRIENLKIILPVCP